MPDVTLASIEYGGYISLAKLIPLILIYYIWILLINWISRDSRAVRTKTVTWVSIMLTAGVIGLAAWLLIPVYAIGIIIYLIAVLTVTMVYVMHRNSLVADFEKVLTIQHFKSILSNEEKKMESASKGLSFITANGNPIDIPEPKSKEAYGFTVACNLMDDAIWRRASEVALMPAQEGYSVTFKIDGVSTKRDSIAREEIDYFLFFIKHLADLDVEERRKPQKGTFKARKSGKNYEWQVKTAGSRVGEQVVMKQVMDYSVMTIEDAGFDCKQIEAIKKWRNTKEGLVLISGPKESGVTSTLYALLKNHDPYLNTIVTLEKKPASEIESVTQNVFTMSDTGTSTYDKRLTSIIRFGPDIVGVGDVDDGATAAVASSVSDKKLIYATIQSESCLESLQKWIKMVKDKEAATKNLIGLVSIRLMRKLCDECREAYQPNPETLKKLNIKPENAKLLYRPGEVEYKRSGKPIICEKCQGTGYFGVTAVFETVFINDEMRAAIASAKSMQDITLAFRKSGMLLMQEQAIKKVVEGELAINEVVRTLKSSEKPVKKTK